MRCSAIVRGAVAFALVALCLAVSAASAMAEVLRLDSPLCHSVTELRAPDTRLAALRFRCTGKPQAYRQDSLWLRVPADRLPAMRDGLTLVAHQSRFDRLAVAFSYADGAVVWQQVRSGDFGTHWRAGGLIAFDAPDRDVPLNAITMRFDRLATYDILHLRLMARGESAIQSTGLALLIGAALTLLLIGGVYNLSLGRAARRAYLAWQGAWAICMLVWGMVWTQAHLLIVPGTAGRGSAQSATFLSCLAVTLATIGVVTAFRRAQVPAALRVATLLLSGAIGLIGIPFSLIGGDALLRLDLVVSLMILADLLCVAACIIWAWRRGSPEARDFIGAWSVPMLALALVTLVDVDDLFWGGGSKVLVLLAAAWQTLWLAMAATRRLADLRRERDHARAAEARAHELARRDPLTGLRNRRGFIEVAEFMLEAARNEAMPAALLLVDVDRFKSVNDQHGHEAGDAVLCTIARRLARWEGPLCKAARLGGEEFALLISGLEGYALAHFAENVRAEIDACDHRDAIGERRVTASIGVAEAGSGSDFQQLYRVADQALYDAKRGGRDQVSLRTRDGLSMPVAGMDRLQA